MGFPVGVTLPVDHIDLPDEFMTMDAVRDMAQALEAAGFDTASVTDHPIPGTRWLENGGHYAQDPFVMLALIAAVTTRLRLQTNILVLPYRNPFITARAVSSLDVFSGGRVSLGVGAGYLKAEYKALGVDLDRRNELMSEYATAMKLAWKGEDFAFEGSGYSAPGNRMLPTPVQKPHPPLVVGGNSRMAIRHAVEFGDAWNPFFAPATVSKTARTTSFSGEDDLEAGLAYLKEHCEKIGREVPPELHLSGLTAITPEYDRQEMVDTLSDYRSRGVKAVTLMIATEQRSAWCELAHDFGEKVIAKLD